MISLFLNYSLFAYKKQIVQKNRPQLVKSEYMFYHKNYQTKKEVIFITSYEFRNDTMFLRNQFKSVGMFKLPLVKKQEISLEDVSLIGYDKVKQN